ncbi:hypothetical protein Daus18300_008187 [Diaporthe australafricana]|uniref:NACHT-NTPase and P-loop NTPases N-terminal domain-containing protein n=1 Tax=Diaporthe australafricana TaxID=127596 RepID=A0ABR3WJF9_9PEZI
MSGAEIIGLVSGIIAIVDAIVKVQDAVRDASGLPRSFRDAASWMPLLKATMLSIQGDLNVRSDEESVLALQNVLHDCNKKVQDLEKIFGAVKLAADKSRTHRYFSAGRAWSKSKRLEELTQGIQADMQLLAANYIINASSRTRISRRLEEEGLPDIWQQGHANMGIANYGSGSQNIHTGNGNQTVNTGSGGQFTGNFAGPFIFNTSAGK